MRCSPWKQLRFWKCRRSEQRWLAGISVLLPRRTPRSLWRSTHRQGWNRMEKPDGEARPARFLRCVQALRGSGESARWVPRRLSTDPVCATSQRRKLRSDGLAIRKNPLVPAGCEHGEAVEGQREIGDVLADWTVLSAGVPCSRQEPPTLSFRNGGAWRNGGGAESRGRRYRN